jgi:hypothetical protein
MLVPDDGFDGLQIQVGLGCDQLSLKDLIHVPARLKRQIAAVLDLTVEVLIMKPAALLLVPIRCKAPADGVNPTLADLAQPPYSRGI